MCNRTPDAPNLKSVEMDQACYMNGTALSIYNAPQLQSFTGKAGNFTKISTLVLNSTAGGRTFP